MKTRKKTGFVLIALLLMSTCSFGQLFSWSGIPGQSTANTFTLQSSWLGTATVTAYYSEGGPKVPDRFQPTVFRQSNTLSAQFSAAATSALPKSIFVAVATGNTIRFRGYLILSATTLTLNPNGIDAVLASKVDKAPGKTLTSNDFSNTYKAKVDSLAYKWNQVWTALAGKGDAARSDDNVFDGVNTFSPLFEGTDQVAVTVSPQIGLSDALNPTALQINPTTYGSGDANTITLIRAQLDSVDKFKVTSYGGITAANLSLKIRTVTATTSVALDDNTIVADATSSAFNVILPDASTCPGRVMTVFRENSGSNDVTVSTFGGNINHSSTYVLSAQDKYVTVQSNGIKYRVIANN